MLELNATLADVGLNKVMVCAAGFVPFGEPTKMKPVLSRDGVRLVFGEATVSTIVTACGELGAFGALMVIWP